MPLILCPDCGNKISDLAPTCPQCGRPNAAGVANPSRAGAVEADHLLLEVHPSRWLFFWYYFFWFLILPPLLAMWNRAGTSLKVHTNRVVIQEGMVSRDIKEIFCSDVRSVEVRQGLLQRMGGIGDIVIGNSASDSEEVSCGIPNPVAVKDLILSQKRGAGRTSR
jgi:hypothetical protein